MKWMVSIILCMACIHAQPTEEEYFTFKCINLIADLVWGIVTKYEAKVEKLNETLKSLDKSFEVACSEKVLFGKEYKEIKSKIETMFCLTESLPDEQLSDLLKTKSSMVHIEDMTSSWPFFNTAATCRRGFLLEFDGNLSVSLWSPWGKIPIVFSYVEDREASLGAKNKILQLFAADEVYRNEFIEKTIYVVKKIDCYTAHLCLPIATMSDTSDTPAVREDDFMEKWDAMKQHYNKEYSIKEKQYPRVNYGGYHDDIKRITLQRLQMKTDRITRKQYPPLHPIKPEEKKKPKKLVKKSADPLAAAKQAEIGITAYRGCTNKPYMLPCPIG